MIKKLKNISKKIGINAVAHGLGYRSVGTIYQWFKNNKIPRLAELRVKSYLKGKKC